MHDSMLAVCSMILPQRQDARDGFVLEAATDADWKSQIEPSARPLDPCDSHDRDGSESTVNGSRLTWSEQPLPAVGSSAAQATLKRDLRQGSLSSRSSRMPDSG